MPRASLTELEVMGARERILREAVGIVSRKGFAGLSMRTLGEAVNLTPGALYRYFPSKQNLLRAMWKNGIDELTAVFAAFVVGSDPIKALRGMMIAYAEFALADHDRFRVLFLENDQGNFELVAGDLDTLAPYDVLRNCVSLASREGVFPKDIDRTSQILWASVHGAVTLLITVREVDFGNGQSFISETIDAALRGLQRKDK